MYDACPIIKCHYDPDVPFNRWKKLLYNASFNSVATILRMDTARMRFSEHVIVSRNPLHYAFALLVSQEPCAISHFGESELR